MISETVNGFSFCRFFGSFEPIFSSKLGANIDKSILAPNFELKIGQNNPKKSTKPKSVNSLSVTVLAKNSAATIRETLASLRDFDEVLLFDTGSTDRTVEIASEFKNVRVVKGEFQGFGKTHNLASGLAKYDWILSVDSDEEVSKELSQEILGLQLDVGNVYLVNRHNYFHGKHIKCCAGWHPDRIVRLYHRGVTRFSEDSVHEKIVVKGLRVAPLSYPLIHTPYRTIDEFLHKMQLYSTLFAEERGGRVKSSLTKAIGHGVAAFFKSYVLKRGFLGGREGFILSLYNGHTAYYKYLKLAFHKSDL